MKRLEHVNFSLWDVKYCTNISYQLTDIHKYPNVIENFCNSVLLAKTNNKQAAFNLTKFISNDTFTLEYEDYDYFNDYLQTYFYDWKLLYSYLPRGSKEFEKLLENYFPCVIKVIKDTPTQDPGGHRLFWGIWLTTMMDGSQRKEVVKTLLEAYEQVRIKLEEREEQFNKEEKLREEFREKERRLKSSEDVLVRHNVVICDNIPWVRSIPFLIDSKLPYWIYSVMHPESVNYEDLIVPANFWKNTEAILNEANEFIKQ